MISLSLSRSHLGRTLFMSASWALALVHFAICESGLAQPLTDAPDQLALLSVAEKTDYNETATYDQVMELCQLLAKSDRVRLTELGQSSQGRPIPLLVISASPPNKAADVDPSQQLTMLMLGNIHAGEVCGKEALLRLARELSQGAYPDLLDNAVLLIAPIYNADGNQPFSKENRPGQHGPDGGVGQRANGQGLDLNRDHIKLTAPETRGFAQLFE